MQKVGVVLPKNVYVVPFWFKSASIKTEKKLPISKMVPGSIYVHDKFGLCRFVGVDNSVENSEKLCLDFKDGKIKIDVSLIGLLYSNVPLKILFPVTRLVISTKAGSAYDFISMFTGIPFLGGLGYTIIGKGPDPFVVY